MKIVKEIIGKPIKFGGEEHEGWLPPNASMPKATSIENTKIDIQIVKEGGGYLLIWESQSGSKAGDTWHETIADAERHAKNQLALRSGNGRTVKRQPSQKTPGNKMPRGRRTTKVDEKKRCGASTTVRAAEQPVAAEATKRTSRHGL